MLPPRTENEGRKGPAIPPGPMPGARLPLGRITVVAAILYFGMVFIVAFAAGTVRTLLLAPRLGEVPAVLLEVPMILAVAWLAAGFLLSRLPVGLGGAAALLAMGALAFGILMLAEAGLAVAFGKTLTQWLGAIATPAGMIGLAGQIGFALIPWVRGR